MNRRTVLLLGLGTISGGASLLGASKLMATTEGVGNIATLDDQNNSNDAHSASKVNSNKVNSMLDANPDTIEKLELSAEEWRARLSEEAFYVLRKEGTERPFTSELNDEKRAGQYACAGCGLALFNHDQKFDSGTGWPSFFDTIDGHVNTKKDYKLILPRTEYHCARCGGHQGHVFKDGPAPTGLRYCNNGVALTFVPNEG